MPHLRERIRAALSGFTTGASVEVLAREARADETVALIQERRTREAEDAEADRKARRELQLSILELADADDPHPMGRPSFGQYAKTTRYKEAADEWIEARKEAGAYENGREVEAFGDPDDKVVGSGGGHSAQFRRVTVNGEVPLPADHYTIISKSRFLDVKSPLKGACTRLTARYVGGNGIEVHASDSPKDAAPGAEDIPQRKTVQEILDDFRGDPYNRWLFDTEELTARFRIDGQLVILADVAPSDGDQTGGRVRLRRWDPRDIVSIKFEDQNPDAPEYLRIIGANPPNDEHEAAAKARDTEGFVSEDHAATSIWRVIRKRDAEVPEDSGRFASHRKTPGALDGDAFWFRANTAVHDLGLPDGVSVFHLLDQWDETRNLAVKSARVKALYAIAFKLEGFTKEKLEEYKKDYRLPLGPAAFFGNEKSSIEGLTFDIGANQMEEHLLGQKKAILAAWGFPPSFVAEDNATLATALAQSAPTLRAMLAKQTAMEEIYREIFQFVVDTAKEHGVLLADVDDTFEVVMSPLSADQSATQAGTLNATALALAQMSDILPREVRARVAQNALVQTELITFDEMTEVLALPAGSTIDPPPLEDIAEIAAAERPPGGGGFGSTPPGIPKSPALEIADRLTKQKSAILKAWENDPAAIDALIEVAGE